MSTNSDPPTELLSFEEPIETFLANNRNLSLPQVVDKIFKMLVNTRVLNVDLKSQRAFSEYLHASGPDEFYKVRDLPGEIPVFEQSILVNYDGLIALSSRTMERICENNAELLENNPHKLAETLYNTIFEVTDEDNDFHDISDSLAHDVLRGLGNIEDYGNNLSDIVAKITTFYRRDQEKEVDRTQYENEEDRQNALKLIKAFSTKITANVIVDLRYRLKRALKHYLVEYFENEQQMQYGASVAKNDSGESLKSKNEIIRQLVSNTARFVREQLIEES